MADKDAYILHLEQENKKLKDAVREGQGGFLNLYNQVKAYGLYERQVVLHQGIHEKAIEQLKDCIYVHPVPTEGATCSLTG